MATGPGLRERKREQTRQQILQAARTLFAERGFEAVTVAEIAHAAQYSEVTVFNYFPTKEDLVFAGMEFFEEALLAAVRDRPPGESALSAFQRPVLDGCRQLDQPGRATAVARAAALIDSSPALRTREREIVARYTRELAALLAEQSNAAPDDVEAQAVAGALMAAHRALVTYIRQTAHSGHRAGLAQDAQTQATRAFARLESGLTGYPNRKADHD
jgi:AcrR family transcriptional regulator